ncbi:hypothetical protein BSKO_12057 [Bryopsis sp. KO-2023]|nr:hypothetical protein BSKO_12057 [Bryopsis sp. KO-2023]
MQPLKSRSAMFTPVAADNDLDRSPDHADASSTPSAEDAGWKGNWGGSSHRGRSRRQPKQGFWHQPHLLMNLSAVVFFCVGCLMMVASRHKNHTQLIMNYPSSSTNLDVSMVVKETNPLSSEATKLVLQEDITQKRKFEKVEFGAYGNYMLFSEALDLKTSFVFPKNGTNSIEEELGDDENAIKLFIGVMSACCTDLDKERRDLIRQTWMQYSINRHKNIQIKFILGQPGNETSPSAINALKDELSLHDDMIIVPGLDTYENLPLKTLGLMRYVLSSPVQYTHVLKTDNDCFVRVHKIFDSLKSADGTYMMQYVYMGCMENKSGFWPIRDPNSKWHLSWEELSDDMARQIRGTKYLAGWGYVLSRDMVSHAVWKANKWDNKEEKAPFWYDILKWEDVLMGLLLKDRLQYPQEANGFKAAWRACTNQTAIRHLDFDANQLFKGLYEQEVNGLWDMKTVQCSTGHFLAGDYAGWKAWRNSVTPPSQRVF